MTDLPPNQRREPAASADAAERTLVVEGPQSNFLGLPEEASRYETSRVVVLPVPFERTTSYGKGTALGPEAILRASHQVELWEEMLRSEPWRMGIATLPPFLAEAPRRGSGAGGDRGRGASPPRQPASSSSPSAASTASPRRPCAPRAPSTASSASCSSTPTPTCGRSTTARRGATPASCADSTRTASRRSPSVSARCATRRRRSSPARACPPSGAGSCPPASASSRPLERLPPKVYLTFDVDFFDPALMPATGTPVPGGGEWYPTLDCLRELFARKTVVAMDVVELAPQAGAHGADFLAASLVYKCLAYLQAAGEAKG